MIGTWTPPGNIFTVEFDDEALTLKLVKKTSIPEDEPISWMTFDVRSPTTYGISVWPAVLLIPLPSHRIPNISSTRKRIYTGPR